MDLKASNLVTTRPVTIKVSWRRVIQTAPYESETLELGVEDEWNIAETGVRRDTEAAQMAAQYFRTLVVEGDKLTQERLRKVKK